MAGWQSCFRIMIRRSVSKLLLLSIAMSLAFAAQSTVYLSPGPCNTGDEVWYAFTWTEDVVVADENGNTTTIPGTSTWTGSSAVNDGVFEFDVDGSTGYNIIFVRMNPNGANVPSWDASWNQTDDLSLMVDATYTISGWRDGTNRMNGNWQLPPVPATGKTVWQQTDPNGANFLSHRRALTGRHCMVNKLVSVVEVGNWVRDLDNMTDEDISNVAVFPSVASVGVGAKPITSIRDTKNHYAAGTTAGFSLVASTGASVLNLAAANAWAINFYLEGKLMATKAVSTGQNAGGVGLSLIKIPGSDEVTLDVSATAPCEFDEISLMPTGLADASVVTNTRVKYAFVGDYKNYTITQTSMQNYAAAHGRLPFSLDQGAKQRQGGNSLVVNGTETGYWAGSDLINDDLTDGVAWGVISIGANLDCRVGAAINRDDPDQSMPFKAGSTVGFKVSTGSLLKLPVGTWAKVRLFKGEWVEKSSAIWGTYYEYVQTEVQEETINANVLSLSLVSGGEQFPTITAKEDFSHIEVTFYTVLSVDLGGMKGWYAFVSDPAESNHQCNLMPTANTSICDSETSRQLTVEGTDANGDPIAVTWSIEQQPSGANASIDANGLLTGMTEEGEYVVKATAADGCADYVTITRGLYVSTASCDNPIVNADDSNPAYVLSETVNDGGALININGNLLDSENVLNPTLDDFAIYQNALNATVVENLPIVGVRKTNGLISDGSQAHRIGFVVEAQSTGLGADVIDLFNIRTYQNGVQTESKVIKESNAVKVKLIGSNRVQKLRFAVDIPAGVAFDEFVLWKSGVLDLSIDRFKIYYAFDEAIADEDEPTECFDPIGCSATMVSNLTKARIDGNHVQFAGGVNAANVVDNLTFLVDDDINTGVSISNTVSLGDGLVLAVDLGHVYTPGHQVGIIMDSRTYLAGVNAGSWVTVKTFLNGVEQERQSDWSVLGVNAIGYGDKSYIFMNPTKDYDAITITIANIANLLDFDSKYYGIFVRSDYDQDGTPDCHDDDSCVEEFTLDEEATMLAKGRDYTGANLALHRSFNLFQWNCIVLPVDLTWLQLRNAFGNDVQLAEPYDFYTFNNRTNVLTYKPYDANTADDVTAIEAGKYYLILPTREADMPAMIGNVQQIYTTLENKQQVTLNGPVYFISDVSYSQQWDNVTPDTRELHHKSSTNQQGRSWRAESNETVVVHGSLIYLDGAINSKVPASTDENEYYKYTDDNELEMLREDYDMLGFRFYLENRTDLPLSHGDDLITAIGDVSAAPVGQRKGVYTIDGRRLSDNTPVTELPAGVYIINGQKVVSVNQ